MTEKTGLDDYFAAGGTPEELIADAVTSLPTLGPTYFLRDGCTYWNKHTKDDIVPTLLANFAARIVAQVTRDDGAETTKVLEIEAALGGRTHRFSVPSTHFAAMNWVLEHLGAGAIVAPGLGLRDHLRAAIQTMSDSIAESTVYTHTGWRQIDSEWVYLHAGGAIGTVGTVANVKVDLPGEIARIELPDPPTGEAEVAAIRASLGLIELTGNDASGDVVMVPCLALTYRAVLGPCDVSLHLHGETGEKKSEIAARLAQHYGAGFDRLNLLSWESTANFTEYMSFAAKDAVLTIDDFVPQGSVHDRAKMYQQADRVFRGAGNRSGRGRLNGDGSPRTTRHARGIVISTGEDVPRGRSLQARVVIVEVPTQPRDCPPAPGAVRLDVLTRCQDHGESGLFAACTAGFVRWIAGQHDAITARVRAVSREARDRARPLGTHARDPEKVAHMFTGWTVFLDYAVAAGALGRQEVDALLERVWVALSESAAAQVAHQVASDPVARFIELFASAVASGRAHVADVDGGPPEGGEARFGWTRRTSSARASGGIDWTPRGDRIAWVAGDDLYVEPDAALRAVNEVLAGAEHIGPATTLGRSLKERKLLRTTDAKRKRIKVRRTLEHRVMDVWHVAAGTLLPGDDRPNCPNRPTQVGIDQGLSDPTACARDSASQAAAAPSSEPPHVHVAGSTVAPPEPSPLDGWDGLDGHQTGGDRSGGDRTVCTAGPRDGRGPSPAGTETNSSRDLTLDAETTASLGDRGDDLDDGDVCCATRPWEPTS